MTRAILITSLMALALAAQKPIAAVNTDKAGVALRGYDPVAYFSEGKPMKGTTKFTHVWDGATWQFVSAANREEFGKDPAKYAPQFGGYCAWAVSKGYTADADPQAWKIVDGKLYVNYNKDVQSQWEKDMPERIRAAEQNWPRLHK